MSLFHVVALQPATVSRCGMIYLEPTTLGWRPLALSWTNALPEVLTKEHVPLINEMFEWLVEPSLTFVRKHCKVACFSIYIHSIICCVGVFLIYFIL